MSRKLPSWIGAPAVLGGVLVCAASGQTGGSNPLLLTAGIMGLGGLTLASERWRRREAASRALAIEGEPSAGSERS